ncbi:FAD-binding oxidoreductase [Nonomuraea typhae]|uniref:FAD-binding oxidoreductase n=1 Tax=Nonomuraea typhae TaxID=2603600 RepID=UPI0012F91817|nr:FAD-binding oxidoreductase [Nonomuraea typhae]
MTKNLRDVVKGRVLLPGDEEFEQARKPWNVAVDQPVAAVVEAADAGDVEALVRQAKKDGLTIAAQPSGHGATGDTGGAILLRTAALDAVEIRPEERLARVGAGARWGQVQAAAGEHGLTGLAGSMPLVSVTGYTLGGGLSWFSRKYGYAAERVRAFDVVDADGVARRVSADSDPDLFFALRGGGGDFALVTAVEFELFPEPLLYGGTITWPGHLAPEVFAAFREITSAAPRELSLWAARVQFPGAPPMVGISAAYLGSADEGRDLLAGLDAIGGALSDSRGALATADLGVITNEPTDPSPGASRGELLSELDDKATEILLAEPIDPLIAVQVRHLGGALADPATAASGTVAEPYLVYMLGLAITPEMAQGARDKQARLAQALGGYVSGRKPYTFLSASDTAAAAFPAQTLDRLREIKRARDPQGVFRANFPVLG